MTTKATHTPGPLRKVRSMREGRAALVDAENKLLCVAVAADPEGERLARLALCWNTHDELVAALREAKEHVADLHAMKCAASAPEVHRALDSCSCETAVAYRSARAALAKVEGGSNA